MDTEQELLRKIGEVESLAVNGSPEAQAVTQAVCVLARVLLFMYRQPDGELLP